MMPRLIMFPQCSAPVCSCILITINVPVVFMARYVMVLRGATSLRGALEGVGQRGEGEGSAIWAQKSRDFQGPPLPMPRVMMLHSTKPLSTSAIKTTGTLVVLCTRVLCCCVLLRVRGVGRSPCSCVV
jgi:hypothetical protein